MTATVTPIRAYHPEHPTRARIDALRIETEMLRQAIEKAAARKRAAFATAFALGLILGAAGASFAAPVPPHSEACVALTAEGDLYAALVVPDWPGGAAMPTEQQQDAIFAADGLGDPNAREALRVYGLAMDQGCW